MLLKVDVDSETFEKIRRLIDQGKYGDVYQFVSIAIKNQVQEEFADSLLEGSRIPVGEAAKIFSESKSLPVDVSTFEWRNKIKNFPAQESEIEPNYDLHDGLIWNFYNRFLPVKLIIRQLAVLIANHNDWIDLAELQSDSYQSAIKVSERLREYEEQHDLSRNLRLSTGLPTPISEKNIVKGIREKRKIENRIESSRKRFMEQFVGKKTTMNGKSQFKGSCFDMGLMAVKFSGNTTQVNLTQIGMEFALLNNPILDEQKNDVPFSPLESKFILKYIIPKFKLENIIVNRILDELKKEKLSSDDITEIFKEEKEEFLKERQESTAKIEEKTEKKAITDERVATMGRLSELGFVIWEVDKEGYSSYSMKK